MTLRSSFSQHQKFIECKRYWFYKYIQGIKPIEDTTYMDAGNSVHHTLEKFYNEEKDHVKLKEYFNSEWIKYKLHEGKLKLQQDAYWNMVLNALDKNIPATSAEFTIFYPEVLANIDLLDSQTHTIHDWKTGSPYNYHKQQLLLYAWLYKRRFNVTPTKGVIHYLQQKDKTVEILFTEFDIQQTAAWYKSILSAMETIASKNELPPRCAECDPYCAYMDICKPKEDIMPFNLSIIYNTIRIDSIVPELLHRGLEKKFSYELKAARFIKKYNPLIDTIIRFWNKNKQTLPIGFYHGLMKTLSDFAEYNKKQPDISIVDNRRFNNEKITMPEKTLDSIELRDYQKEAVDAAIEKKIGILKLGTGAGKTNILIELIRQLNMPTLFVCEKIDLLQQTKSRLEKALGIPIGIIGQSESNIQFVTICTIQTISKHLKEYAAYLSTIRLLIIDETHHAAAKTYIKLNRYMINAEYRIGATGTPFRDDGNELFMHSIVGYPIYEMNANELIEKKWLMKPVIYFIENYMTPEEEYKAKIASTTGLINETPDYRRIYQHYISENETRNVLISRLVEKHKGKKILVLCKLIDHERMLSQMIPGSEHLYGGTNKKIRIELIERFRKENFPLISTMSIFSEGLDIPALDMVINATANAGSVKSIQSLGRILRISEGKEFPIYYDFIDYHKMMRRASNNRYRCFTKEDHIIKTIDAADATSP